MYTTALIIFSLTYLGIIFTRLPWVNIDRPSAAFFGAVAMVIFGVLSFDEAVKAVDFHTLALLLGMMVIITTLELDGFFSLIASKTLSWSKTPFRLLVIITFVTGIASAFLVNDAVVLLFTPVIIRLCRASDINPMPYLLAEILASNVGSTMTMTGNPQNMLIGINSNLSYGSFMWHLLPVSLAGLFIIIFVIRIFYPGEFKNTDKLIAGSNGNFTYEYRSMKYSIPVFAGVIILFFFGKIIGLSIPMIALSGAAIILIFGKVKPSKIIKNIDWVLLLFFASLFVVVEGAVKAGVMGFFMNTGRLSENVHGIAFIHGISLFMSQLVSNVPFTVMMLHVLKPLSSDILWLSLASASTLAGNATIIGAMANLIVIESANREGIHISFGQFFKVGIITTILTLIVSLVVLMGWYYR